MVARRFFTDSRSGYGAGWVTYSIVDFTHFEIYLGGVAVVIYIERVGLLILAFLIYVILEDYLFFVFLLVLHLLRCFLDHSVFL
ncbi:hypothetical protein RhiirC2_552905 [Rhizophagus irregularis]|uniref:Uncharacterized protein n=1 Tax=Rhizophagus irregularis TaxID=588596 RepID=A0A2N1N2G3_9GLOM|nr:hypothetical protein RhiirC2_552905 [Rhizophagus irregularis]